MKHPEEVYKILESILEDTELNFSTFAQKGASYFPEYLKKRNDILQKALELIYEDR